MYFNKDIKAGLFEVKIDGSTFKQEWFVGMDLEVCRWEKQKKKQQEHEENTPDVIGFTEKREYSLTIFSLDELIEKPMSFFRNMPLKYYARIMYETISF